MDIRSFQYVVAIADQQSITKASEKVFISQPALTKFLQQHERELGFRLFSRADRKLIPTKEGELYLSYARSILERYYEMEKAIKDIATEQEKHLTVAISPRRGSIHALVYPRFRKLYPNVCVTTTEEKSSYIPEYIIYGKADLGFCYNAEEYADKLNYEPVAEDELMLCLPQSGEYSGGYKILEKGKCFPSIDLSSIRKFKFAVPDKKTHTGRLAVNYLCSADINDENMTEIFTSDISSQLCMSGYYCCFLFLSYIKQRMLEDKLQIFSAGIKVKLSAVYGRTDYVPKSIRSYIKIAKEVLNHEC